MEPEQVHVKLDHFTSHHYMPKVLGGQIASDVSFTKESTLLNNVRR